MAPRAPSYSLGRALAARALAAPAAAQVPSWAQSWALNKSTIMMTCNYTGFVDPSTTVGWTIVDFGASGGGARAAAVGRARALSRPTPSSDWSNAKKLWAAARPMNCEELLIQQVEMTAAASPGTTSFVYRNAIKALPWCESARQTRRRARAHCGTTTAVRFAGRGRR